jgi:hypothetical protein
MADGEIGYSDIPPLGDGPLGKGFIGLPRKEASVVA